MLSHSPSPRIRTRQIIDADIHSAANFLSGGFSRSSPQDWLLFFDRLTKHPTPPGLPKYGYLMERDGTPIGVVLLISSVIRADDVNTTRCNLSSWYVLPAYRSYAALFVSQILKHKDVTYVNVSAADHTLPILKAQGFSKYTSGQFFAIPTPFTLLGESGVSVVDVNAFHDWHLDPVEHDLLLRHAQYGCTSVWCMTSGRAYPFVFRSRVVKGFIRCAQLIYCRDMEEFTRFARPLIRFLALRGQAIVVIDANGRIPGIAGTYISGVRPRYFRGPAPPRLGDLAYTEAAMFGIY